ncbi:MAG TPA: hypothetical protein VM695_11425 [Phycisphaerae bacterium]|nr:hypothetical protein [Phycisphaerae bacterium]
MTHPDVNLLCHRCGALLTPGAGDFYVVRIEAFADPTPPDLSIEDLAAADPAEEIERLLELMRDMTEQELLDQVYRRLTIHLCGPCYRRWIEDPAGSHQTS